MNLYVVTVSTPDDDEMLKKLRGSMHLLNGVWDTLEAAWDYAVKLNHNKALNWKEVQSDNPDFQGVTQCWEAVLTAWHTPCIISIEVTKLNRPSIPADDV